MRIICYKAYNNYITHDFQSEELPEILKICKELGIKCSHCHDIDDASKDTQEKEIARGMMKLTKSLNASFNTVSTEHENYKTYVSCWTCHRGNLKPEYIKPNN